MTISTPLTRSRQAVASMPAAPVTNRFGVPRGAASTTTPTAAEPPRQSRLSTEDKAAILAECQAELRAKEQERERKAIAAGWDAIHDAVEARRSGVLAEEADDGPDPHGWREIHAKVEASRGTAFHYIGAKGDTGGDDDARAKANNYGWDAIHDEVEANRGERHEF